MNFLQKVLGSIPARSTILTNIRMVNNYLTNPKMHTCHNWHRKILLTKCLQLDGGRRLTGSFYIRFFTKNHKHYHSAMIISNFYAGLIFLLIGIAGARFTEIFTFVLYFFGGLSFLSGFYYIINKKRKKPTMKMSSNSS